MLRVLDDTHPAILSKSFLSPIIFKQASHAVLDAEVASKFTVS